jgi:glycerol-3-phosphate O-acyltransferase
MVLIAIAGNTLQIHPTGDMSKDLTTKDVMIFQASEAMPCAQFRSAARNETPEGEDPKQHVADAVMARLDEIHAAAAAIREERLKALSS